MASEKTHLWELGRKTLQELEVETGVLASGRNELYGCIFGRDSLITCLQLLSTYQRTGDREFLGVTEKILTHLSRLQGTAVNPQSGEEPGKCIHEYRPTDHEHLTRNHEPRWYVYPDGEMRIYDTVDATPLLLIATYRHYQLSRDEEFLARMRPHVEAALEWTFTYADSDGDGLIDYRIPEERTHGGLDVQSWMDSSESVFHEDGTPVTRPIAPVEVQAYTYLAWRLWEKELPEQADRCRTRADSLKRRFNEAYPQRDGDEWYLAAAVDGAGKPMTSRRSSMAHVLWAAQTPELDGTLDCILAHEDVPRLVHRLFESDLYEPAAGLRTLSDRSRAYDPNSYHNGSFWPHDISLAIEGLERFGYRDRAGQLRDSLLNAMEHFSTAIELFGFSDGEFFPYTHGGQLSCMNQAWSAGALLMLTAPMTPDPLVRR